MAAIREEIVGLCNSAAILFGGGDLRTGLYAVANEATDVLAAIVTAIDDDNREADVAALKAELAAASAELATRVELPWWIAGTLPAVANALVDKLATFSGSVEQFKQDVLLPFYSAVEAVGHRGRVYLGG